MEVTLCVWIKIVKNVIGSMSAMCDVKLWRVLLPQNPIIIIIIIFFFSFFYTIVFCLLDKKN